MVKATPSEPIRVPPGGRVELECTVFGSPVPQAQWNRGIQLNQVNKLFKMCSSIDTFQIIINYMLL